MGRRSGIFELDLCLDERCGLGTRGGRQNIGPAHGNTVTDSRPRKAEWDRYQGRGWRRMEEAEATLVGNFGKG